MIIEARKNVKVLRKQKKNFHGGLLVDVEVHKIHKICFAQSGRWSIFSKFCEKKAGKLNDLHKALGLIKNSTSWGCFLCCNNERKKGGKILIYVDWSDSLIIDLIVHWTVIKVSLTPGWNSIENAPIVWGKLFLKGLKILRNSKVRKNNSSLEILTN